jgi:hypothetical protein
MIDKLISFFNRLFFTLACILLLLAIWDRVLQLFGWTIDWQYGAGRILEFSAIMMIFVIALLLRQIREQLKNK